MRAVVSRLKVQILGTPGPAFGPGIALSPRPNPPFRLHQIAQNIVDAGQAPFAFGTQPIEHLRIETHVKVRKRTGANAAG